MPSLSQRFSKSGKSISTISPICFCATINATVAPVCPAPMMAILGRLKLICLPPNDIDSSTTYLPAHPLQVLFVEASGECLFLVAASVTFIGCVSSIIAVNTSLVAVELHVRLVACSFALPPLYQHQPRLYCTNISSTIMVTIPPSTSSCFTNWTLVAF